MNSPGSLCDVQRFIGMTKLTRCILIATPPYPNLFSPWSEHSVRRLALILNLGLGIKKSPACANHVFFTSEEQLNGKNKAAGCVWSPLLISSPHMDSSRFRKINRMLSKNLLCVQFFKQMSIKIKAGAGGEMPPECIEILPQSAAQLGFPSPLGILLINQGNWLALFHSEVLMTV